MLYAVGDLCIFAEEGLLVIDAAGGVLSCDSLYEGWIRLAVKSMA